MASLSGTAITAQASTTSGIPWGLPGQMDGRPTLQTDRADETQQQFSYQCIAGVVLLCAAVTGKNDYVAIWMEHHDDLLADCGTGKFDAIQSKTSVNGGAKWKCADEGFVDAIRKFCAHEERHGVRVRKHLLFSNIKPYVPGATTKKPKSLANSPLRLIDECQRRKSCSQITEPYKAALFELSAAVGQAPELVFRVLRKMVFHKGPQMEAFTDQLPIVVAEVPECSELPIARLREIGRNLYNRLHSASTLDVSLLSLQSSPIAQDGRELAAVLAKKVSVDEAKQILLRHPGESFLYDSHGMLTLGKGQGQKEILRAKMKAGGVENFFTSIWLQAISAEKRLMEEAIRDPRRALVKLNQLEAVIVVECQNAEAEFSGDPEDVRGKNIYKRILTRTAELSNEDSGQVLNERVETLRGMAGLLSGSCHFAWGKPLPANEEASHDI